MRYILLNHCRVYCRHWCIVTVRYELDNWPVRAMSTTTATEAAECISAVETEYGHWFVSVTVTIANISSQRASQVSR